MSATYRPCLPNLRTTTTAIVHTAPRSAEHGFVCCPIQRAPFCTMSTSERLECMPARLLPPSRAVGWNYRVIVHGAFQHRLFTSLPGGERIGEMRPLILEPTRLCTRVPTAIPPQLTNDASR